jgi:hypothetical protein
VVRIYFVVEDLEARVSGGKELLKRDPTKESKNLCTKKGHQKI